MEAGGVTVLERFIPFKWGEAGLAHVHREMLGLVFAVAVGRLQLADKCVQIRVDSMSTVKYVRDRGGSSEIMSYLTKKLWSLFFTHRISLARVCHIKGTEMVAVGVDGISRPPNPKALSEADRMEWQVEPGWWQWIVEQLGARDISLSCDRFACRANALLDRFCSLREEPGALFPPNAFTHRRPGRR